VISAMPAVSRHFSPETIETVLPFEGTLARHGLKLVRGKTHTLQVNVGYLCDLLCPHCHLEAGPERREVMTVETMNDAIEYASRVRFETIDITCGCSETSSP
jgi:cytochrome c